MSYSLHMKTGKRRLHLKRPRQRLALPGDSAELLVASAAGRTASSGLFFRLVGCATSRTTGGGLFLRLVRCAASGTGPARQIGKCHDCLPPTMFVEHFLSANLSYPGIGTNASTHLFITQSPFCNLLHISVPCIII